jgi:hypothetical protein
MITTEIINSDHILAHEDSAFLITAFMYHNEVINRAKFMSVLKQLRTKTFLRKVNTYYSKINDRWYDHEGTFTILKDVWSDSKVFNRIVKKSISMDEFLGYVNLLLNAPKNYCIDYTYERFIVPHIVAYGNNNYGNRCLQILQNMTGVFDGTVVSYDRFEPSGYCCEEHDGDFATYKSYQYENNILKINVALIKDKFKSYFDKKRTASHWYNLNNKKNVK